MDTPLQGSSSRTTSWARGIFSGVYGAILAGVAWWLIDDLATERFQRLNRAEPAEVPLIGIALVAVIATAALLPSRIALLAAVAVTTLGIVLGGYGSGSALVPLPNDDVQFTLLRGAHEPAIWALVAVWLTIAVSRFRRTSSNSPG